jgi:uncharacterized protein DUF4845
MYANSHRGLRSKQRQSGMTTLGLVILVSFIGIFAFAGLRLTPVYLNYMKVVGVVSGVHDEFDGANATRAMIRSSISRRFDIESVGEITARDVKVTKVDGGYEVAATYSHKAPFVANVSFIVDFDKRALVRR